MRTILVAIFLLSLLSESGINAHLHSPPIGPNPLVNTKYGLVEGFFHRIGKRADGQMQDALIFLGIPFARPPTEKLRFEVFILVDFLFNSISDPESDTPNQIPSHFWQTNSD